ncbi:hypothetical protein Hanom_Chr03g00218731 [Helianthus anomalus]
MMYLYNFNKYPSSKTTLPQTLTPSRYAKGIYSIGRVARHLEIDFYYFIPSHYAKALLSTVARRDGYFF